MVLQQFTLLLLLLLPMQENVRHEDTPAGNLIERNFHTAFDYTLRWGTKSFMRSLPDTFTINGLNNAYFWYESNRYLLLKINENDYRSKLLVLPLDDSSQVQHFKDVITFNARTNLLVCMEKKNSVQFTDLTTGAQASMHVALPKGAKNILSCIDSATMTKTELQLHWMKTPPQQIHSYRIPKLARPLTH